MHWPDTTAWLSRAHSAVAALVTCAMNLRLGWAAVEDDTSASAAADIGLMLILCIMLQMHQESMDAATFVSLVELHTQNR